MRIKSVTHIPITVVIPTVGRPALLRSCLDSLACQTRVPDEIIVSGVADDVATAQMLNEYPRIPGCMLRYHVCRQRGASAQRNEAIDQASGDIVFFLDDDVECEPVFVASILEIYEQDPAGEIGGVSGTIENQASLPPSRLNHLFMRWMAGYRLDDYGGRVIGPAWNHLPMDNGNAVQDVEWLPSCCVAYRASVLRSCRFNEAFGNYSFAEDLHHSACVGRTLRLVNTGRARMYHHDLGQRSHRNPRELGKAQVVNRWIIMRDVLGRTGWSARLKLAVLQVYFGVAEARTCMKKGGWKRSAAVWLGRMEGLRVVMCDRISETSTVGHHVCCSQ